MTPLRIDIHLKTAMVVPAMPIHLDALIAFAQTEQEIELGTEAQSIRELADHLPLDKAERDGEWVWKASALIPNEPGEQQLRMWTRKTNPHELSTLIENGEVAWKAYKPPLKVMGLKIDTTRGLLKNHFQFYAVRDTKLLSAWCVGDRDEIEALLARMSHIGSKRRVGHGEVERIEVVVDEAATEAWKARILPWRESDTYEPVQAAIRPPYWAPEQKRVAYCPVMSF